MRKSGLALLFMFVVACGSATPETVAPSATSTLPHTPTAPAVRSTDTPLPGFTLIPSTPILPTATDIPCANDAVFLTDVTVPDNSQLLPGAPIDKRWKVQNTGTCNWDSRYRLAFFEGSQMNAAGESAIYPAKTGAEAALQINMTAPDVPGDYTGRWLLRDPEGKPFGPVLFIKITVIPLPTPTASP